MACLATFDHWPEGGAVRTEGADVELVNHTRAPVSVALFRAAAGQLDCAALDSGDRSALGAAAFTAVESCIELDPVEAARIGQLVITSADADAGVPAVDAGSFPGCHAVAVRATGLADTVLFWDSLHFGFVLDPLDPASVYLEQAGSRLYLAGSPYIQAWTADFALPRSGCAGAP
jgi:hypothetical protein